MLSSNGLYEARVVIRGRTEINATEVVHENQTYIEGREGTEYELWFKNHSDKRVLILPSVDGLSILDGKPAGLESPGYIVDANSHVQIPGWKVDSTTAARFAFARKGSTSTNPAKRTYAENVGADPANIGVIGIAVFTEKEKVVLPPPPAPVIIKEYIPYPVQPAIWPNTSPFYPYLTGGPTVTLNDSTGLCNVSETLSAQSVSDSAPANSVQTRGISGPISCSGSAEANLGTGFGDATSFETSVAEFVRAHQNSPTFVFTFIYDTLVNLQRMGVPVEKFRTVRGSAPRNAFPASPSMTGCPVPSGWKKS